MKEKWEEERQEKDKALLDMRHRLEEQKREREEEVKVFLEKQVMAVEEATKRLESCHQEEIKDLMEKQQQEVRLSKLNLYHIQTFRLLYRNVIY